MNRQPPLDDPPSRFALVIFWINGLLMNRGEKITKPLGQSSARWQVLGRAGGSPQTVAQMARDMGLSRQSVQRVVNVLQGDGLVRLEEIPSDKRTARVALTPTGEEVLGAIYKRNSAWTRRISRRIPAEQFDKAIEALRHIGAILEEDARG